MARPQIENGHTKIANELVEALARHNLSAYESRVLWCIFRKTYGWNKKTDRVSYTQFAAATGIDRRHISRAINSLKSRSIIICNGRGYDLEYGIQKNYELWDLTPKEATVIDTNLGNGLTPKEAMNTDNNLTPIQGDLTPIQGGALPKEATNLTPKEATTKAIKHLTKDTIQKKVYGEFENVFLTDRDYQLLVKRLTEPMAKEWIETLSSGMAANPKKYKYDDHRAAILQWERRDRKEVQQNGAYRGNNKRIGTRLPDRNAYTEPPFDPQVAAFAEADRREREATERADSPET